jgi:hypothetical protein
MANSEDFRFNDEFFVDERELRRMRDRYPRVGFAFHTPQATQLFLRVDATARQAKATFQRFGLVTVLLALTALVLAAIEPVWIAPAARAGTLHPNAAKTVALLAALAGTSALLVGWAGLGIGERKHNWIKYRLIAERLRQWQAQFVCSHIPQILAAARSAQGMVQFMAARDASFAEFESNHVASVGARITSLLSRNRAEQSPTLWVDHSLERAARAPLSVTGQDLPALEELFEAFDNIRFRAQVDYAEYMRGHGRIRSHPLTQHHVLSVAGYACIVAVLILDLAVIAGVLGEVPLLKSPEVHLLTIVAALGGLAVRVLEDGLRPDVHVARLEGYLEEISRARQRFRDATAADEKLTQMRALEESAALEMIGFLKAATSSRYVL